MTVSEIERFTSGQTIGVDVAAIERDLAALWRKASSQNASVTRACSWNLVIHTANEAELERARVLADALVAAVPSRTVILNHRPNAAGPEIEAFVTANCKMMPGGGKLVCAEEITIEARGRGGDHLPSLLRALLVPDIPTAVMWSDLPSASNMGDLLGGVERVVFDSTRATELSGVEQLGAKITARVADLNWLRAASLRLIIAAAFDAPADTGNLFRIDRLSIECSASAMACTRLLIGWLAERLSWGTPERLTDRETPGWLFPRQQGQVFVDVTAREGVPYGVQRLVFGAGPRRIELTVKDGSIVIDNDGIAHSVPYSVHNDEELIVAALGSRGSDRLYPSALHGAAELER